MHTLRNAWATPSEKYKVLSFSNGGITRITTVLHKGWGKAYKCSGTEQPPKEGLRHKIITWKTLNSYISHTLKLTTGRSDQQKVTNQTRESKNVNNEGLGRMFRGVDAELHSPYGMSHDESWCWKCDRERQWTELLLSGRKIKNFIMAKTSCALTTDSSCIQVEVCFSLPGWNEWILTHLHRNGEDDSGYLIILLKTT